MNEAKKLVLAMVEGLKNEKACGGCTACCTVKGVCELGKPFYTPCRHLCEAGCGIYNERPHECKGYQCLWKIDIVPGDERRRPDKLGVIFEVDTLDGGWWLKMYEVWPGAFSDGYDARQPIKWVIQKILTRYPFLVGACLYPAGSKPGLNYPIDTEHYPDNGESGMIPMYVKTPDGKKSLFVRNDTDPLVPKF